jgi:hypothetical protein
VLLPYLSWALQIAKVRARATSENHAHAAIERLHALNPSIAKGRLGFLQLDPAALKQAVKAARSIEREEVRLNVLGISQLFPAVISHTLTAVSQSTTPDWHGQATRRPVMASRWAWVSSEQKEPSEQRPPLHLAPVADADEPHSHLGHYLFTTKLLPLLERTAATPGSDVRIVTVSISLAVSPAESF